MSASNMEVQGAAAFLKQRKIKGLSPRKLAASSNELGKNYADTVKYLVLLMSGGQGVGQAPAATADENRIDPIRAIGKPSPEQLMEYDSGHP